MVAGRVARRRWAHGAAEIAVAIGLLVVFIYAVKLAAARILARSLDAQTTATSQVGAPLLTAGTIASTMSSAAVGGGVGAETPRRN